MAAWVLGLPLLFVRRWPQLTRLYALFAVAFVLVNQISRYFLGECVLTTFARMARAGESTSGEWFTVRAAEAIFHLTPTHHSIKIVTEGLIFVTAAGVLLLRSRGSGAPALNAPHSREESRS